jgi:uncharacterized protein
MIFIDTSAFFAVIDRDDEHHVPAARTWRKLIDQSETMYTNNYVLLETISLLQRRLGLSAINDFIYALELVDIAWVSAEDHERGLVGLLTAARRNLSLTDCVSFETMRRMGIQRAFTFDPHFAEQGFKCIP